MRWTSLPRLSSLHESNHAVQKEKRGQAMGYKKFLTSLSLCALLVSSSACTYLIPEEPSADRYNMVLGARHAPVSNGDLALPVDPAETSADMSENDKPLPMVTHADAAPVADVAMAPLPEPAAMSTAPALAGLPPVDAATQARAQQELAAAPQRQVPVENNAIQLAQSDGLNSVPLRPAMTGRTSPQEQFNATKNDLEQERESIGYAREQLRHDAGQEPSLLSQPEQTGTVPTTAPVPLPHLSKTPTTSIPPQSDAGRPMTIVPSQTDSARPMGLIPPPPPLMANNLPPSQIVEMQPLTPPAPATSPIRLHPPTTQPMPTAPMPQTMAAATPQQVSAPMPEMGGFDPLATAAVSPAAASKTPYSGSGYIAQSRYAAKR